MRTWFVFAFALLSIAFAATNGDSGLIAGVQQGQTALMWASAGNHADAAKILSDAGADVDARSTVWPEEIKRPANGNLVSKRPKGGLTPLLYAAREGALDSVRVLVKAGANLNIT